MRPTLLSLVAGAGALGLAFCAGAAAEPRSASSDTIGGVVELFTSQGCASCPPAERILEKLARDPTLVALAYHVDYWDYIGWRDTYGSKTNTDRQRAYAKAFATSTIYTPQAVVNGRKGVVGSHEARIRDALAETAATSAATGARVALRLGGDTLKIDADLGALQPGAPTPVLMLVTFDSRTEVPVDRGENAGKVLVNVHAVRDWRILGMWAGEPMTISIPLATLSLESLSGTGCAAILQSVTDTGAPGAILAAAILEFDGGDGVDAPD